MNSEVAAHATVRTDGIGLGLAALIPGAGLPHVIFALEHQRAGGADADAVATIDAGGIRQGNVEFGGDVSGETAASHGDGKSILRVHPTGFDTLVAENALGIVADV